MDLFSTLNPDTMGSVLTFLRGPALSMVRDVGTFRLLSKAHNQVATQYKDMAGFWHRQLNRAAHNRARMEHFGRLSVHYCYRHLDMTPERKDIINMASRRVAGDKAALSLVRDRLGECGNQDHYGGRFAFDRSPDGLHARSLYLEWLALSAKKFGLTWNQHKASKLASLRSRVAVLEAEHHRDQVCRKRYTKVIEEDNKARRQRKKSKPS